ncbi:unnamed protein product [Mortierella alpina]
MQKGFLNKGQAKPKEVEPIKSMTGDQAKPKTEDQAQPKVEEPQSREYYEALAEKYIQDMAEEMGGTLSHDPETETTRIHSGWRFNN